VTIHYRWHPFFGRSLEVVRRISRAGRAFIHCELPDATIGQIPLWMTDAAFCGAMTTGTPRASLGALADLRRLLDAHLGDGAGARPASPGADEKRRAVDGPDAERMPNEPMHAKPLAVPGRDGARRATRSR
jgi:hypothetical protein